MQKIMNRIAHFLPSEVKLFLERRMEKLEGQKLLANTQELTRLTNRLRDCRHFQEYLEYATDEFHLLQKPSEIKSLIELLQIERPIVVGEIGAFRCGNLFLFRHAVKSIEKIIAIDRVFRQRYMLQELTGHKKCFRFVQGDSRSANTVGAVRRELGQDKFDFLFIDGDHTYEGVKADFSTYRQFVRDGGLIAFHDIVPDLTTRMRSDVPLSKSYAGGVPIFWSEVKDGYSSFEFIDDSGQDGFGIGVIRLSNPASKPLNNDTNNTREGR